MGCTLQSSASPFVYAHVGRFGLSDTVLDTTAAAAGGGNPPVIVGHYYRMTLLTDFATLPPPPVVQNLTFSNVTFGCYVTQQCQVFDDSNTGVYAFSYDTLPGSLSMNGCTFVWTTSNAPMQIGTTLSVTNCSFVGQMQGMLDSAPLRGFSV